MSVACLPRACAPDVSRHRPDVAIRPLEAGDVPEIFAGLGARSRELRFLTPKPRLTAADLRQLTQVDQREHVAIVAVAEGRPVGVARFVRDPGDPATADVAVAVVDDWQGRGVGTLLVEALASRAHEDGVRRFTLMMATDNVAAFRLLDRAPGDVKRIAVDEHVAEFAITLPPPKLRLVSADPSEVHAGERRPVRSSRGRAPTRHKFTSTF